MDEYMDTHCLACKRDARDVPGATPLIEFSSGHDPVRLCGECWEFFLDQVPPGILKAMTQVTTKVVDSYSLN